ncbi:hypothetical protein [Borborobacter arsenicus]|uniref:hypothetical protein n=1 Tax=Borborobacter arsenicus TaxID=1851146 RepID=UPI001404F513|nr:hypothetical protein [Pseudaminobacter arsenicus]
MKDKVERIRELRSAGLGLYEAKRTIELQDLDTEIRDAKTIDDIRSILCSITARLR